MHDIEHFGRVAPRKMIANTEAKTAPPEEQESVCLEEDHYNNEHRHKEKDRVDCKRPLSISRRATFLRIVFRIFQSHKKVGNAAIIVLGTVVKSMYFMVKNINTAHACSKDCGV